MGIHSKIRILTVLPAMVLTAGVSLPGGSALAQQALTVPEIRACTCEERTMADLRRQNDAAKAIYDERVTREQNLSQQIELLRATMDPNDLMAQDQLRELIDLRARVAQDRRDRALPGWQNAAKRLNTVVMDYNAKCAGRTIYQIDNDEAQKNLICPVTP
jgi:hypothetical protein